MNSLRQVELKFNSRRILPQSTIFPAANHFLQLILRIASKLFQARHSARKISVSWQFTGFCEAERVTGRQKTNGPSNLTSRVKLSFWTIYNNRNLELCPKEQVSQSAIEIQRAGELPLLDISRAQARSFVRLQPSPSLCYWPK